MVSDSNFSFSCGDWALVLNASVHKSNVSKEQEKGADLENAGLIIYILQKYRGPTGLLINKLYISTRGF